MTCVLLLAFTAVILVHVGLVNEYYSQIVDWKEGTSCDLRRLSPYYFDVIYCMLVVTVLLYTLHIHDITICRKCHYHQPTNVIREW